MVNSVKIHTIAIAAMIIVFCANEALGKKLYLIVVLIVSASAVEFVVTSGWRVGCDKLTFSGQ